MAAAPLFGPLFGHDMWIEPTTFSPESGEIVGLRLKVGQDLLGDPLARDSALIKQFIVEDPEGRKPVVGRDGGNPAGFVRAAEPGLLVIGYNSNPSPVELTPEKFNQYLTDEGLDRIPRQSAKVHEIFSRCAKSLVLSGSPAGADRALGFTLELVAERNPYTVRSGQEIPFRLTYQGKPLAGALVIAINKQNPMEKISARTGAEGRVRFKLHPGGMWLVKAVHMIPAAPGSNADYQSYWASLTFEGRQ